MEDHKNPVWRHEIKVIDREQITIDGVLNMGSYDDQEVILETDHGVLILKGQGLNIKSLNLEQGSLVVEGLLISMNYDDHAKLGNKNKGFLSRILK